MRLYFQNLDLWNGERINGVLYAASVAWLWSDIELAAIGLYRPKEPATIPDGKVIGSALEWDGSAVRFKLVDGPTLLEQARAEKLAEINAQVDARLAAGAPVDGLHVALDGDTRADVNAVATAALGAQAGAPWPEDFARGFITIENVRIVLETPAEGYAFANTVGAYYAALRQHGRDLKDAAEAAETIDDLDDIDETAGWPT
jgi:hypothetical protein